MRARFRWWWEFLPFTAKATLIVAVAGLTVTATARAATLVESPSRAANGSAPQVVLAQPGVGHAAPRPQVALASFAAPPARPSTVIPTRRAPGSSHGRHLGRQHAHQRGVGGGMGHGDLSAQAEATAGSHASRAKGAVDHAVPMLLMSARHTPVKH